MSQITLTFLTDDDREQFILDNQRAFKYGALEEFGERDNHFEEDGRIVGGLVLLIDNETQHNHRSVRCHCGYGSYRSSRS